MLATRPVLGIKRIFPLIKEHAPDGITVLPSFAALPRGTRLAIDATLWIQRLHFTPDQHPDRHVFGFHRLIRQIRQNGLIPIMVFDNFGQQARLPAKTREHQRRRSQRCMLTLRAKIEEQRAKRLAVLQRILEQYKQLPDADRARISRLLSGWRDGESTKLEMEGSWESLSLEEHSEFEHIEVAQNDDVAPTHDTYDAIDVSLDEQDQELDAMFSTTTIHGEDNGTFESFRVLDIVEKEQRTPENYTIQGRRRNFNRVPWDDGLWTQVIQAEASESFILASRVRALRRQYALHVARANAGTAISRATTSNWPKESQVQQQMTYSEGEVYRAIEDGVSDPQMRTSIPEQAQLATEERTQELSESTDGNLQTPLAADDVESEIVHDFPTEHASQGASDASTEMLEAQSELQDVSPLLDKTRIEYGQEMEAVSLNEVKQEEQEKVMVTADEENQFGGHDRPEFQMDEDLPSTQSMATTFETRASLDGTALDDIETLTERNAHMQRYYERSSASLSQSAFEACASLCEMLNVPVLWTGSGNKGQGRPHEAEALAAMLVRQGYADLVVSEDSDVLLYDVPLLRGVMGAKKLELVDSALVRRTLFPPSLAPASPKRRRRTVQAEADDEGADDLGIITAEEQVDLDPVIDAEQSVLSATDSERESVELKSGKEEERVKESPATEHEDAAERASRRQMLDFALLCGTDFNRTIPGIASSRALRLIREFGSIEGIRSEAVRRAVLEKRRIAKQNTTGLRTLVKSSTQASGKSKTPIDPIGSSLVPSLRTEAGLRTPDHLTWREYGKELTQARHVFEQPPTLFWQLRKVRDLKRDKQESINAAMLAASSVDRKAIRTFMRKRGAKDEEWDETIASDRRSFRQNKVNKQHASSTSSASPPPIDGFGAGPFKDGGPIATWP